MRCRQRRNSQHARQILGALGVLAHAHVERRAREIQGVVQPLLHLDAKPAIDAAIEELEREEINDDERRHDEHAKDRHGAGGEARTGDVISIIPHELQQLARDERAQRDDADEIEQQDPRLQAAELARVLHALAEKQERANANRSPKNDERYAAPARPPGYRRIYTGRDHEYHSLVRCQSSVQNMSARKEDGNLPRRTPARTPTWY